MVVNLFRNSESAFFNRPSSFSSVQLITYKSLEYLHSPSMAFERQLEKMHFVRKVMRHSKRLIVKNEGRASFFNISRYREATNSLLNG